MIRGVVAITILHCGCVNGCSKYNSHLYLRKSLRWRKSNFFPVKDGKSLLEIIKSDFWWCWVVMDFPNEINPMMPSTWLLICARCQSLVQQSVRKVRLVDWLCCWKPIVTFKAYTSTESSPNLANKTWHGLKINVARIISHFEIWCGRL